MDWNMSPSENTDSLNNLQSQGAYSSQTFSNASAFPPTNMCFQNTCIYSNRNNQTALNQSNNRILANHPLPHQNTEGYITFQQGFSTVPVPNRSFVASQPSGNGQPVSQVHTSSKHPNRTILPARVAQNRWPNAASNVPVSSHARLSTAASQTGSGSSIQIIHQNRYVAPTVCPMQPQNVQPNSTRTILYQGNQECSKSSKETLTLWLPQYNLNAPASSQECTTVPLNQSSNQYLNYQQNFSSPGLPQNQKVHKQVHCPSTTLQVVHSSNPNTEVSVQSQQYAPVYISTHNENPPPYRVSPVQTNHNHFVQPLPNVNQSIQNICNENITNQEKSLSDSSSFVQQWPKQQFLATARDGSCALGTMYNVNMTENQTSNVPPRPSANMELCNIGTVPCEAISQLPNKRALAQESQISASIDLSGEPKTLLSEHREITKDSLNKYVQPLPNVKQSTQNICNENIPNQEKPLSVSSNFVQQWPKHQSLATPRDGSCADGTMFNVNVNMTDNQTSIVPPRPTANTEHCNIGTVPCEAISQLPNKRTLTKENQISASTDLPGKPKTLHSQHGEITKDSLSRDALYLVKARKAIINLTKEFIIKRHLYLSAESSKNTSDPSLLNQNTNLPHVANNSQGRPLLSSITESQPLPVHQSLPQESTGEQLTSNGIGELVKTQNSHLISQENTSSAVLISNQGKLSNNGILVERFLLHPNNSSAIGPRQEPLKCTQNISGVKQTVESGTIQSREISTGPAKVFSQSHTGVLKKEKAGTLASKILVSLLQKEKTALPVTEETFCSNRLIAKEANEKFQCSVSACFEFDQQNKATFSQPAERSITGLNNEISCISDTHQTADSCLTDPQAGIVQDTLPVTEGSCTPSSSTYSVEELTACLALWRKCPSESLDVHCSQSGKSVESSKISSSSNEEFYDMKTCHNLENIKNAVIQDKQTEVIVSTNERVLPSANTSVGQKHDALGFNLVKGFEPQIAIVPPLIHSKEKIDSEQQEKYQVDRSYPVIEEGSVCSLQEIVSIVAKTNKWAEETASIVEKKTDSNIQDTAAKSTDGNRLIKTGVSSECSYEPNGNIGQFGPDVEENKLQFSLHNNSLPKPSRNCPSSGSDKGVKKGGDGQGLLEPGDVSTVVSNDAMLQISSVCTLVEGNTLYNSQIANIFGPGPSEDFENDNDLSKENVAYPKHKEQQLDTCNNESLMKTSVLEEEMLLPLQNIPSKARKSMEDLPSLEMLASDTHKISDITNESISEGAKSTITSTSWQEIEQQVACEDIKNREKVVADVKQELTVEKQELFNTVISEISPCLSKKADTKEHVAGEGENLQGGGVSTVFEEASATSLDDQLTELLKEFPFGIESTDPLNARIKSKDGKETQACSKRGGTDGAVDQIKITILNSEQMKELFPEQNKLPSDKEKLEKCQNTQLVVTAKDKDNLESHVQPGKNSHADQVKNTQEISVPQRQKKTAYCCLTAWLAASYAMDPCSCKSTKDVSSNEQKDDLCPESENDSFNEKITDENCCITKPDCEMKSDLLTTVTLHVDKKNLPPGDGGRRCNQNSIITSESELKVIVECKPSKALLESVTPLHSSVKRDTDVSKITDQPKEIQHTAPSSFRKETFQLDEKDSLKHAEKLFSRKFHHPNMEHSTMVTKKHEELHKMERSDKDKTQREGFVVKSKIDPHKGKSTEIIEIKHSKKYEEHKYKNNKNHSGEMHELKGHNRTLSKSVGKTQFSEEIKLKLGKYNYSPTNSTCLNDVNVVSSNYMSSQHKPVLHSQELLHRFKRKENSINNRHLEKTNSEAEQIKRHERNTSKYAQHSKQTTKVTNLEKYAKSGEREIARQYKRSFPANIEIPKQRKRGRPPNRSKIHHYGKERNVDVHNRDRHSEKTLSDKTPLCVNRRASKLNISLKREQKKNYLNKVAFKRTAQESICLSKFEPSPNKSLWTIKSSKVSEHCHNRNADGLSSQDAKLQKPQMLEFKMCPEILFRNTATEEGGLDVKKLPKGENSPVTALKSKKEDWLNYVPMKRRKTIGSEAQVDDSIPLDKAIKILERDEALKTPIKDSMFQTFKKMYLAKRSRSLDSSLS
uniref:Retroelement silencing factor 1 n=1 Tax=Sphenodon punctatus TaxID=8508 RepID=A0A8D0HQA0_SPHPU